MLWKRGHGLRDEEKSREKVTESAEYCICFNIELEYRIWYSVHGTTYHPEWLKWNKPKVWKRRTIEKLAKYPHVEDDESEGEL